MPAHLRSIVEKCDRYTCSSPATKALYNTWNALMGNYCGRHAEAALRELQEKERSGGGTTGF